MTDQGQAPAHGGNGYDGEELGRFLDAIDREHDQLDTLKSEYMTACKGPRGRIREVMKSAKESGISMVAFREVLTQHLFERKSVKRLEDLEPDDRSSFEQMMEALGEFGDTPLGKAALDRVRPADSSGDQTLSSLS
jgi:hypothetical protein